MRWIFDASLTGRRRARIHGSRLRFERVAKGGRATALNGAVKLARAPIVLLFAHDAIAPPETAEAHLRYHRENPDRHLVGVGSLLVPPALRNRFVDWLERTGELFGVPFTADMTSVPENFFYIAHCSIKRDHSRGRTLRREFSRSCLGRFRAGLSAERAGHEIGLCGCGGRTRAPHHHARPPPMHGRGRRGRCCV